MSTRTWPPSSTRAEAAFKFKNACCCAEATDSTGDSNVRWQAPNNWVVGVEGDFNWVEVKNTQTLTAAQLAGAVTFIPGDSLAVKTNWQSSVRGSVGYAWDRVLAYVTGGVAFANMQASSNFIAIGIFPASAGSQTKTLTGGTVGAGIAYAVTKNWDIGAEYRYTRYDGSDFGLGPVRSLSFPRPATSIFRPTKFGSGPTIASTGLGRSLPNTDLSN